MKSNSKTLSREVRFLLLPLLLFGAINLWYWHQRNQPTKLAIQSTNFVLTHHGDVRPMAYFGFWMTYSGRRPKWWGKRSSRCLIKDFKLFDRHGRRVQPTPYMRGKHRVGQLHEVPSGYFPSRDAYEASAGLAIPANSPVQGGTVSATFQIIDSYLKPTTVYLETAIETTASIDCGSWDC